MSDIAIRVDNLSKLFEIGVRRHDSFRDFLTHSLRTLFLRRQPSVSAPAAFDDVHPPPAVRTSQPGAAGSEPETVQPPVALGSPGSHYIWALKEVSFEVTRGERLGIIGRNGAGKSTLLKILSRITQPTSGRAELYGRVGSLLEVGTGFDRELTGRENMYLNGAILGMTKREIDRRADEIVDFSGVANFIDTPVKYYSSGMYVRLAFAVAAHMEPEILIVDEVLAVGDAAFQKKCLGKMEQVARDGRTVLFVSHNLAAVQELCDRGILLTDGTVGATGTSAEVVAMYLESLERGATAELSQRNDRQGTGAVRLTRIEIAGGSGFRSPVLATGQPANFTFHLTRILPRLSCIFTFYDQHGHAVASFNSDLRGPHDSCDPKIGARCVCSLEELLLLPGRYRVNVAILTDAELQDHVEGAAIFEVEGGRVDGRRVADGGRYGSVYFKHRWTLPTC